MPRPHYENVHLTKRRKVGPGLNLGYSLRLGLGLPPEYYKREGNTYPDRKVVLGEMPTGFSDIRQQTLNPASIAKVNAVEPRPPVKPVDCPQNVDNPYHRIKRWIEADILILGPCVISDRDYRILRRGGHKLRYEGVDIVPTSVVRDPWWTRVWRALFE